MSTKKRLYGWLTAIIHALVWLYIYQYYSGVVLVLEVGSIKLPASFISQSLHYGMLFNACIFYLNYHVLIAKYMARNLIRYIVLSTLAVLLITVIESVVDMAVLSDEGFSDLQELNFVLFFFNLKVHGVFWLVSGVLKTSFNWIIQEKAKEAIKAQQTETELALLKSQVHPHFLFNTLNTLYTSAYEFGDDETANGIGKLSHLLRYMLYETKEREVLLEKEIEYLENYIDLQKMRFAKEVNVSFKVYGEVEGLKVAPMLLITLVENAFKHGVSPNIQTEIKIRLDTYNDGRLVFLVENNKLNHRAKIQLVDESGGLGLDNLKKRLNMIYPSKHNLKTEVLANMFIAKLELL
ncbi:sensor histidine kinase [Pseudoalteromonas tetraodonis]|uniref:sensor histidine kinase n=1 Tax=Pseudoalteromonas tetraodonis TaxID=43659 RepID=UPI003A975A70